jgi:SAM-dependent methyltransferase
VDVGCGRGDLLRAFHGYGATAIGLEAADAPHWMLTGAVDGIRIHPTTETGPWPVPDASADLVIFRHTLEHFPDPITALREARRVIRDQGRLVIVVPNWSSRQRRVAGPQWLHLDVPRHCYHFDEGSLRAILNRTEFSPEASWCGEFHQDLYGWPQSVANRLLPGTPNALYRLLQGGPAWETCPSHTAAAMQAVVAALTAPAWLLLYLLAAAERSQAVVTAVARPAGAVPGNAGR